MANMIKLIGLLVVLSVTSVYSQSPQCFDYIKKLAVQDKCLASRIDVKRQAAKTQTKEMFVTTVTGSKCSGTAFACGKTLSWVTEVFQGLINQYNESKFDDYFDGSKIGYSFLTGNDLRNLFVNNRNKPYPVIYQLRFTGNEDHVWMIEQLPLNGGYRTYQSYHDAYSLNAWLSTSVDNLYNAVSGDIMMFNEVKYMADQTVKKLTNGQSSLYASFENSTIIPDIMKPFLRYVRDYDQATVMSNFKRAWSKYGQGKAIPWSSFQTYVNTLADMTAYFKANDNTQTLFSEKVWNDWIDLFASPNPVHFPNLPVNALTSVLLPGKTCRFEIKKVDLTIPPNCYLNSFNIH